MAILEDNGPHVLGSVVALMVLAFVTFGLRLYVRIGSTWGSEDTVMAIAAVPFAVLSISCILGSVNGIGAHAATLAQPGNEKYETLGLMYFFLFEIFYCATIIPIKLSIALMLIRIARNRKAYVWSQWAMMSLFFIADGGAFFYIVFQCTPVSYAWNTAQDGFCLPATYLADIYYTCTAVNIATDWVTALLPIPLLWNVKLERSEKLSVGAILGLGVFASLAACIRLNYTINLTEADDYLYAIADVLIWGYGEIAVGMFVGCLATLRPLFRKVFRLGSTNASSRSKGYGVAAASAASPFPSNARRTYNQVSHSNHGNDQDIEMGNRCDAVFNGSSIKSLSDMQTSMTSDRDSMDQILKEARAQGMGNKSIVVSRQVQVAHSAV